MLYSALDVLSTYSDMDRMSGNDSRHLVLQNIFKITFRSKIILDIFSIKTFIWKIYFSFNILATVVISANMRKMKFLRPLLKKRKWAALRPYPSLYIDLVGTLNKF